MTYDYNPYTLGTYTLAWYNDHNCITENSDDINTKDEDAAEENKDIGSELINILTSLQTAENSQSNSELGEIT